MIVLGDDVDVGFDGHVADDVLDDVAVFPDLGGVVVVGLADVPGVFAQVPDVLS